MNKPIPYLIASLFLYFSLHSPLFSQHTDLKEAGLQGKVKQVTSYHYNALIKTEKSWSPADTNRWRTKSITYYNKNGGIDSIAEYYNTMDRTDPEKTTYRNITTFHFGINHEKKTGVRYSSTENHAQTNSPITKTYVTYYWIGPAHYIESFFDASNNVKTMENECRLNIHYRDSVVRQSIYNNDSLMHHSYNRYYYKNNGDLTVFDEWNVEMPESESTKYHFTYGNPDQSGNFLSRWIFVNNDKDPMYMDHHIIGYYDK